MPCSAEGPQTLQVLPPHHLSCLPSPLTTQPIKIVGCWDGLVEPWHMHTPWGRWSQSLNIWLRQVGQSRPTIREARIEGQTQILWAAAAGRTGPAAFREMTERLVWAGASFWEREEAPGEERP